MCCLAPILSPPWHVLLHRRLPVAAVEALWRDRERIEAVETMGVDVDLVRVGARHIERLDAAHFAEMMLGDPGVELIGREIAFALKQIELLGWHIRCQMPFLVQIEQLQMVTPSRSAVTRKRTRPQ